MTKTLCKAAASLIIFTALTPLAHGQDSTQSSGLDAVYKCAQESDEAKRLACFDAATQQLKTAEDSGELVTVTREDVEEEKRNSFGFATSTLSTFRNLFGSGEGKNDLTDDVIEEVKDTTTEVVEVPSSSTSTASAKESNPSPVLEDINQISVPLLKAEIFGYEKTRFFLANGQVWDQLDRGRFRVPKERNGEQNNVEIRRGALGSYLLQVNGSGKSIAVRRRR